MESRGMSKKLLINIRGTCAVGKTTAMRQYCERAGFKVETVETPFGKLPVSVLTGGNIVVFGDYAKETSCCGTDCYPDGKMSIMDAFVEVCSVYDPQIIIYEHMLSSTTTKGTIEISELARLYGREYHGALLVISEEKRLRNLEERRGKPGKTRTFDSKNGKVAYDATMRLKKAGLPIDVYNVENMKKEDMWRIVDGAVRKALE